jgi:hypothetical protein
VPAAKKPQATPVAKAAIDLDTPERFKMTEAAYLGLNVFNGVSNDELKKELNFPYSVKTYKTMTYHSTVNSALTLFDTLVSKVDWHFKPPADATPEEIRQAEAINSMMHDMQEMTWSDFISDTLSANVFGFSIHEKVYRRRNSRNGSKYNDNLIGWKKLPIRNQESIEKFIFSDDGNEILGVKQNLSQISDLYNRYGSRVIKEVVLPRSKFMLFRAGKHKGDPFGKSLLRDAYLAWRFLSVIEEIEAGGVAKDLSGLPVLAIPPQYLSADATPEQKSIRAYYERVMANMQMNQQSAMILPQAFDPDTRQPLFELKLLSLNGSKAMDTTKIKEYYKNLILISLFSDVLAMGQGSTGSFALGTIKNSLSAAFAESMLRKIVNVINEDLIRQTYELNNWDTSRMGSLDFDNLQSESLEEVGKYFQRLAAVGFLPRTHEVINKGLSSLGVDPISEDTNLDEILTSSISRSGDGMKEGLSSGTGSAAGASGDASVSNLDNV